MAGKSEWYVGTARHAWRTYFAMVEQNVDVSDAVPSDRRLYKACNTVLYEQFVSSDREILRVYHTARWGDDSYTVEDYSNSTGRPIAFIWNVIRRANRAVIEQLGLIEKKGDSQ